MDFIVNQFLTGLASASSLFLVASGLSIIFGVSRIVNFAHGSLYMLGAYLAYWLVGRVGFWAALPLAAAVVAALGAMVEMTLLRRIYRAPELLQLLATFGVVLIVQDGVVAIWGPEDLLGPRAPGLAGALPILGQPFPEYEFFLIVLGPAVLGVLWFVFHRTRWGTLLRAATQDRDMVAALGVNQAWLFTGVFVLGAFLAGLGGALQLPRATVHHAMDMQIIVEAFVVVVIGGLGSMFGAFVAAALISELEAFGILVFPQFTLVFTFLAMAVVLMVRPAGLFGRQEMAERATDTALVPLLRPMSRRVRILVAVGATALLALPLAAGDYALAIGAEIAIFALFAASLHFMMGTGGMISFGHAAYFGLGAYGAALLTRHLALPMLSAVALAPALSMVGALLFGWFCVRLSGVYLAMLTLAFAQIMFAVAVQWSEVTGGDNGLLGIWPAPWASGAMAFYYLALLLCGAAILLLRRVTLAPFGYGLRAGRDSPLRAEAVGIDVARHRWLSFALSGAFAGLAGALYAFLKGSVFPDTLAIGVSVDGLVMVLLGGIQTLGGPVAGAAVYKVLSILVSTYTEWWRTVIGAVILLLVTAFPQGLMGLLAALSRGRKMERPA